jgi:hypothetical protein
VKLRLDEIPGRLAARVAGEYALADFLALIETIAARCSVAGTTRVLLDLSEVTGDPPDLDRYDLGRQAAAILGHVQRVAVVLGPAIRYTGFAVDVAQNRGLDLRSFRSEQEALDWLTGP